MNSVQDRAGVAGDSIKPGARAPGNRRKIPSEPAERATALSKRWSLSANALLPSAPRAWFLRRCRPLRRLSSLALRLPGAPLALHPRLYADACSAGFGATLLRYAL